MITKTWKNLIFPSCLNLLASTLIWCVNNAMFSAMKEAIEYRPIVFEQCRKHLFLPGFYVLILSLGRITIIQFIQKRMMDDPIRNDGGRTRPEKRTSDARRSNFSRRSTLKFLTTLDATKKSSSTLDAMNFQLTTPTPLFLSTLDAEKNRLTTLDAKPITLKTIISPSPRDRTYEGRAEGRERGRGGLRNC